METRGPCRPRFEPAPAGSRGSETDDETEANKMLWLILGIVLLVVAISGGAIIHPIIFVLALVALWLFFTGWRGRGRTV
jgi:hypothetical protein